MDKFVKTPFAVAIALVLVVAIAFMSFIGLMNVYKEQNSTAGEFNTFGSCSQIANYINDNRVENDYGYYDDFGGDIMFDMAIPEAAPMAREQTAGNNGAKQNTTTTNEYSETNIQVEGVDEGDIVKTDGEYLYVLNDKALTVFDVRDVNNVSKVRDLFIDDGVQEMFLNDDQLVIFASDYQVYYSEKYSNLDNSRVKIFVYDISSPEDIALERKVMLQGSFMTSRMVDDYIYIISNSYFNNYEDINSKEVAKFIPLMQDSLSIEQKVYDDYERSAECDEISYYGTNVNSFVSVTAIPLDNSEVNSKVILGDSSNVYMSKNNVYLATVATEYENEGNDGPEPFFDIFRDDIVMPRYPGNRVIARNTDLYRLSVDSGNVEFAASGRVEGTLLNQFSMDEYYKTFRVATTTNDYDGWGADSSNNLIVLNEELEVIGEVNGLGLDEKIYSARFMGDRAYMVTFRQIDPLYVIDLSDPENPEVLGELKMPGVSDYLHPYDEDHVIGIGRDADVSGRIQGLKLAMFDVSDVANPEIMSEVILGERGSNSAVINDHKAFLFDKEKELLSIPVSLQIPRENTEDYWESRYNGFVIFDINLTDGLLERGRVDFTDGSDRYYYGASPRSLYIEDKLITVRDGMLKVSELDTLVEVDSFNL